MRNQWRLLLHRNITRSPFQNPSTTTTNLLLQSQKVNANNFSLLSSFLVRNVSANSFDSDLKTPRFHSFPSESTLKQHDMLTDILSKSSSNDQIKTGLETIDLKISYKMVFNVLRNLEAKPEIAWKFFNFVSETEKERLSSKTYNVMLGILGGRKGYVKEFWGLVEIMKKKGFGVTKVTYVKVSEKFKKEGMVNDLEKLKEVYEAKGDGDFSKELCSAVCKVIRENDWDEDVKQKLRGMEFSNDLVAMVIEHLKEYPTKALMYFWWVEEDSSIAVKHDKVSYDAMIKVLAREDSVDKFWRIVEEMKAAGYQMDMEMYILVMGRFIKRKMIKDAVDLYEFMMSSETKPSVRDSVFLLRKVVVSKDLDMDLFSRVVKMHTDYGNSLTMSILDSVVKSLISVGRLQEIGNILKALEKGGFVPTREVYNKIIFQLGSVWRSDEAIQIMDEMEASEYKPDVKTWSSLIHGQCVARDVEKASSSFRSMVEMVGVEDAGYAFDLLIKGFCQKKKVTDAHTFFSEMVTGAELRPWHTTYKFLIEKLLVKGSFNEALTLLRLMKGNDYPPYLDPFIDHVSKSRTGTDAMRFLRAVTDKRIASTSVFIRMFEAFFKAGRHSEAQNFFSKCPSYIRSHADVLNLFCARKPKVADASAVAVAA